MKNLTLVSITLLFILLSLSPQLYPPSARAAAELPVYTDSLVGGWGDWSWGISNNLNNANPVHSGAASIAVTFTQGWDGFQPGRNDPLDVSAYDILRFWIHGGNSGGQQILLNINDGAVSQPINLTGDDWIQVDVSLADLGNPRSVTKIAWFNNTSGTQAVFYLDDIAFISSGVTPTPPPSGQGPALSIDAAADQRPISPYIYGMNFADEGLAAELSLPVNRWGGNSTTRYNWKLDTTNLASDWYFENYANNPADVNQLPDGSQADLFIEQNKRTHAQTLLTVPLIGWTPVDRGQECGFSIQKYGAQADHDTWRPDCGNGKKPDGVTFITGSPLDTSVAITTTFVQDWVKYLSGKYGNALSGGVRFYDLDNEPFLWDSTHRDVHPNGTSYDELRDRGFQYAAALKAIDPAAQTLGPVEWGWTGYFYSGLDAAAGGAWWDNPVDRLAHGNTPFVEWYLQQMRAYEQVHGVRILDYLDEHFYPQSGVALTGAGNSATQALRLRSTRGLWDPSYIDESWIGDQTRMIPRMHEWVNANYPGTKLAISEYNWGALDSINGALAQADVLGIFGREGLDLATLWGPPSAGQPGAYAFRIFLNYDRMKSKFGETSIRAVSADQDRLAVYAARRSKDGALTLVIINKDPVHMLTSAIGLAHFDPAAWASLYRYDQSNLSAIMHAPDLPVQPTGFNASFPPYSITLVVIPPSTGSVAGQLDLFLPLVVR